MDFILVNKASDCMGFNNITVISANYAAGFFGASFLPSGEEGVFRHLFSRLWNLLQAGLLIF